MCKYFTKSTLQRHAQIFRTTAMLSSHVLPDRVQLSVFIMPVHSANNGSPSRRRKLPRTVRILVLPRVICVCHQILKITDVVGGSTQRLHLRIKQYGVIILLVNFRVGQSDTRDNVYTVLDIQNRQSTVIGPTYIQNRKRRHEFAS